MLGGTVVNITGPCFEPNDKVRCRFDTEEVYGTVIDKNRAICIQPYLLVEGYVTFAIAIGSGKYNWRGKYFVGNIITIPQLYTFLCISGTMSELPSQYFNEEENEQ